MQPPYPPNPQQPPQSSYPQYPGYPKSAPPPSMTPRKRPRIWPWIIGVIGLLLVCACIATATSHSTNSSSASTADNQDATTSPVSHRTVVITQYTATTAPTATPTAKSTPTPEPTHYPPTTEADLHALAAKGDASAIHEFHSEGVGLPVCPQPKREVTVDPGITGQQLAEDLLAYFYAQQLDNACGSVVFAYHTQAEGNDVYTAGRVLLDVTDSSGAVNVDPNGSGLTHKLTLDTGGILTGQQEYNVTY